MTLNRFSTGFPASQVRFAQNFPDPTLWYYATGPVEHIVLPPAAHDPAGARKTIAQLQAAGVQRVILPVQPAPNWDDQQIAGTALAEAYTLVYERQVGVWPVQIYTQRTAPLAPLKFEFRNNVTLTGALLQPPILVPGQLLVVYLQWQGVAQKLTGTEKVFVQLLNASSQLVAQDDRPLDVHRALATYGILLPERLPAGAYQLIAGLYDPAQAGAPRVHTVEGADFVILRQLKFNDK